MREELDGDDGNSKAFDFVIERKNREVKIGIEEHKEKNVREENKKEAKGSCGFKRAEKENQTETSNKDSSSKSWNSSG